MAGRSEGFSLGADVSNPYGKDVPEMSAPGESMRVRLAQPVPACSLSATSLLAPRFSLRFPLRCGAALCYSCAP